MTNKVGRVFGALVSDALEACGVAFSSVEGTVAGELLSAIMRKRLEAARDIALEEIRRGDRPKEDVADGDEVVAIVFKYLECARQGAARRNLRLMARVMRGQAASGSLFADEFLRYADMVASLSHEEVCTLATMYRVRREFLTRRASDWPAHEKRSTLDRVIKERLVGRNKVFRREAELVATRAALQRTGLIYLAGTTASGQAVYEETLLLDRIGDLANLESPLPEEAKR